MGDLVVDLDGLASLASSLDRIRSSLDGTGDLVSSYREDVGDDRLNDRLDNFVEHWADGREKITANAESLSSMLHESVRTYRETDDELSRAITTEG